MTHCGSGERPRQSLGLPAPEERAQLLRQRYLVELSINVSPRHTWGVMVMAPETEDVGIRSWGTETWQEE